MSFMAGLFGDRYAQAGPIDAVLGRVLAPTTDAGVPVNQWLSLNLPGIYRAVSIIADTIAQLPRHVYQKSVDGRTMVEKHPIDILLNQQPNELMTPFTFFQTSLSHALLWGNSYDEIERTFGGIPVALHIMEPDRTTPGRQERGGRYMYRYNGDGEQVELAPPDVLHVKALGYSGEIGYSQIQLHRNTVGLAAALEKFGSKFFANDLKSGGFIYHPATLSPTAQKNIQESMQSQAGVENAHKVKVLEEGAKFIPNTIPPDDAQFLGSREFQIAEVARMYGVPLVLLQSHEKSTAWGSGIEELILGFVKFTIAPWLKAIEEEYTRKLFTEEERDKGYYIKFALQALLRGDMATRAAFYQTLAQLGTLSPNEIRAFEEMNTDPELDFYYYPANMQRVDKPLPDDTPEQQQRREQEARLVAAQIKALEEDVGAE